MNTRSNILMPGEPLTRETIRSRADKPAIAIDLADAHDPRSLCDEIEARLKAIFVVTEQLCDVLVRLVDAARVHGENRYGCETDYWKRVQASKQPSDGGTYSDRAATLVTGLPGCGKSAMGNALMRILSPAEIYLPTQKINIVTIPVIIHRLAASSAEKAMARTLYKLFVGSPPKEKTNMHELLEDLARHMLARGTLVALLDELQFLTHSEGTIGKAVSFLINSLTFDVPLVYCANYSLVHKLMKRPGEEKQRLLANVIEILPEAGDSEDWIKIISEAQKVAPSIFSYDPVNDAQQLFRWTAGVGRLLRHLLIQGLRLVAAEKYPKVTMDVLQRAFHSTNYTSDREDVEVIINFGISSAGHHARPDLWSPFPRNRLSDRFADSAEAAQLKQQTYAAAMSTLPHAAQREQIKSLQSAPAAPVVNIKRSSRRTRIADNTREALAEIGQEVVTR